MAHIPWPLLKPIKTLELFYLMSHFISLSESRYTVTSSLKVSKTKHGFCKVTYTAVSTKVVQKSVNAYATMPKGSLGNIQ